MWLSLALQEMGRYWLPALYLADAARYEAPNAPGRYWSTPRPSPLSTANAHYGYDPMSPYSVQRAAATALDHLPELLTPIHAPCARLDE